MRIYLGDKFYKYKEETDTLEIIRIKKIKNENLFSYEINGVIHSISKQDLLNQYTRLKPDGLVAFTIVNLENKLKDVIVSLYRMKDLEDGKLVPYCACRQNIFDMFTNQVQKGKTMYVGVSVSQDTMPDDTPFEIVLACNGIDYMNQVSVYLDDTLEDIMSYVNKSKFDETLSTIYNNVTNKDIKGYCNSLKQLLEENDFMYDFLTAYNIIRVNFAIDKDVEELDPFRREYIEGILKEEMFKTYVVKYDKEIDLKKIERSHILISDKNKEIFIIAYDKGEYINREYAKNIRDKRDAIALLKHKKPTSK